MNATDPLPGKNPMLKYLLAAGAVFGSLCLLSGGISWFRLMEQDQRVQEAHRAMALVRQSSDPHAIQTLRKLATAAGELSVPLDDLEYSRLHGRWRENLRQFDLLLAARGNKYVAATLQDVLGKTRKGLLDLRGECSNYLQNRTEHSIPRATWKIYNLQGCLAAMAAYVSLEFDEDGRESGKFLNDAVEDFKAALRAAEKENASTYERQLVGWNLELIVGAGEALVMGQAIMEENMTTVQEQLAPVMPNFGGYSPGAPLDIYVDK
jgi:hypothetical protein